MAELNSSQSTDLRTTPETAEPAMKATGVFGNRRFRLFWGGHLVSLIGDQVFPMALIAVAIARGGDTVRTISLIYASRFAALALLVLVGGVLADRVERMRMMIQLDLFRALAVVVLIVAGTSAPLAILVVLTFALGAGEALFTPLYDAVVPSLVDESQLKAANSISSMVKNSATVVGPALAAVLVTAVGPRASLLLDVLSFLVSALAVAALRKTVTVPSPKDAEESRDSLWRSAVRGFRLVLGIRWLLGLEAMAVLHVLLAVGPWLVLLPVIVHQRTGGIRDYGLLLGMFGGGGVAGAWLGGKLHLRLPGLAALCGIACFALACLALAVRLPLPVTCCAFVAGGFGTQMFDVFKTTAIQESVPGELLGRVFALDFFASFVLMPLGQLAAGITAFGISPQAVMTVAGIVVAVTSFLPLLVRGTATLGAGSRPAPASAPPLASGVAD